MRTSRPDGISQANRSHPFFIILRKVADDQRRTAYAAVKNLIRYGEFVIPIPLIIFGINPMHAANFFVSLAFSAAIGINLLGRYFDLKKILQICCYDEVDHMIYSNEYQTQNLNIEQVLNMVNDGNLVLGRIQAFNDQSKRNLISTYILAIPTIIAMVFIRFI